MRRALLASLLLATIAAPAGAESPSDGEAIGEAISGVQTTARVIDRISAYCSGKFADDAVGAASARAWHARNGQWERAADGLRTYARTVVEREGSDVADFDRQLDAIMDQGATDLLAKFDAMPSDDERRNGCQRFAGAVDEGAMDIETNWQKSLPLLRDYLK